ncbi:methyltransferase [Bacillus wiedmannii]|nr:methyltransferase [Bacillus wiedmannii]MBZ4224625.1 methyltransferase [Bacillus wiedmannii]MED2930790.1 methyltransferase [Bacillus wiedmannii]
MKNFNEVIATHLSLETVIPIGDGMTISKVKK